MNHSKPGLGEKQFVHNLDLSPPVHTQEEMLNLEKSFRVGDRYACCSAKARMLKGPRALRLQGCRSGGSRHLI